MAETVKRVLRYRLVFSSRLIVSVAVRAYSPTPIFCARKSANLGVSSVPAVVQPGLWDGETPSGYAAAASYTWCRPPSTGRARTT